MSRSVRHSGALLTRVEDLRLDRGWSRRELCEAIERLTHCRIDPSGISRALARGGCSALMARALEKFLAADAARLAKRTKRPKRAAVGGRAVYGASL